MLSVGTTASAGLKDWVHSFYSNLNVLESGLANQNYDSTHIKTQCFTIAIVSFFELSEHTKKWLWLIDWLVLNAVFQLYHGL